MLTVEYDLDHKSEWRWRVRAANHEIIASGEGYKRRVDAEHAISLLTNGLPTAQARVATESAMTRGLMSLGNAPTFQMQVNDLNPFGILGRAPRKGLLG